MVQASNSGRRKRFFSSSKRPDWSWGPGSRLFKRYQGTFLGGKVATARSLVLRESQTPTRRPFSVTSPLYGLQLLWVNASCSFYCGSYRHMECSLHLTMLSTDVTFCLCETLWSGLPHCWGSFTTHNYTHTTHNYTHTQHTTHNYTSHTHSTYN